MVFHPLSPYLGTILVLCVLSFLYKENPFYRIAESLFVAVSVGYGFVYNIWNFRRLTWTPLTTNWSANWWYVIAIFIGLFYYSYWSRKYFFLYRIPLSYAVGLSIGTGLYGTVYKSFVVQITSTFLGVAETPFDTFSNIVIIIGVLTSITFFYFSKEHTGLLGVSSRIGRYFILIFLGAAFGNTVMGRTALFITRATEIIQYPNWTMVPLVVAIFVAIEVVRKLGYLKEFSPEVARAFNVTAKES